MVTGGFKPSMVTAGFKPSMVTAGFKPSMVTAGFKREYFIIIIIEVSGCKTQGENFGIM